MLRKSILALLPMALFSCSSLAMATDPQCCDCVSEFFYPSHDTLPGVRVECHSGKVWPPYEARLSGCPEPIIHRYHTAHYWPDPYRWNDRSSVRAHLESARGAGWMTATTLYEQHFDPNTNELNEAGRMHIRWIMLHVPANRRATWVQAGDTAQVSQARLASVQVAANRVFGNDCPAVMLRVCEPYGASAQEVDLVRRAYLSSWPVPRLPVKASGTAQNLGGKSLDAGEGGP